jgi:hypothetical protein
VVSWTFFHRPTVFSAVSRISASFKVTVTSFEWRQAFREDEGPP